MELPPEWKEVSLPPLLPRPTADLVVLTIELSALFYLFEGGFRFMVEHGMKLFGAC